MTFAADGSFIIALPSGLPIFRSGISAENLSRYRWDERLETPAFAEEIDDDRESIRCHTNFRHPFNLSWSGKTCDIRRSSKTTS